MSPTGTAAPKQRRKALGDVACNNAD